MESNKIYLKDWETTQKFYEDGIFKNPHNLYWTGDKISTQTIFSDYGFFCITVDKEKIQYLRIIFIKEKFRNKGIGTYILN